MKRRKLTLTLNDAHCMACGEQLAELGACACHGPRPDYSGLSDDGDRLHGDRSAYPPGYIPGPLTNSRRMEPIPDVDWFPSDDDGPTANAQGDADGLVVNEGAKGGLPELDIDYAALSVLPSHLCRR